jgi:hypothetical protein
MGLISAKDRGPKMKIGTLQARPFFESATTDGFWYGLI